jgi:hypothetical protein
MAAAVVQGGRWWQRGLVVQNIDEQIMEQYADR